MSFDKNSLYLSIMEDIEKVMSKHLYESPKYVLDPRTGQMVIKERPEDKINLMSICPRMSGWIVMLKTRTILNSIGNRRYAELVWFDFPSKTVSSGPDKKDAVHFKSYMLPGSGKPAGWIYKKDYPY